MTAHCVPGECKKCGRTLLTNGEHVFFSWLGLEVGFFFLFTAALVYGWLLGRVGLAIVSIALVAFVVLSVIERHKRKCPGCGERF